MAQTPDHSPDTEHPIGVAVGVRRLSGLRAMVAEDEKALAALVGTHLQRVGFEVQVVNDGRTAVTVAREFDPDLVVLALGLPGLDGFEVCRQLRVFSDAYVMMLTARSDEVDTLIGLSVGADDYMRKPFSPRELTARVSSILRRLLLPGQQRPQSPTNAGRAGAGLTAARTFGALTVDVVGRDVWLGGVTIPLTRTEFDLLATLSGQPQMAFSRRQLIDAVWGPEWVSDEHLVDVHIGHLRRKLDDDANESQFVRTVRGIGYRMGTG